MYVNDVTGFTSTRVEHLEIKGRWLRLMPDCLATPTDCLERLKRGTWRSCTLLNGLDPFLLASKVGPENDSPSTCDLPPVEATDLVFFLVLETSFVTAKQLKAHKSMEAYNQFVSGYHKSVVTGRVSFIHGL